MRPPASRTSYVSTVLDDLDAGGRCIRYHGGTTAASALWPARESLLDRNRGFEGLLAAEEHLQPRELPVRDVMDIGHLEVHFDPALPSAASLPRNAHHDVFAHVDQLDEIHPEVLPLARPVLHRLANGTGSFI